MTSETETRNLTGRGYPWPSLELFGLASLIGCVYGFQYLVAQDRLVLYFALASVPFSLFLAALSFQAYWWRSMVKNSAVSCRPLAGFTLVSLSLGLTIYLWSMALRPIPWLPVTLSTIGVAYVCHRRWGAKGSNYAFLICAFIFFSLMVVRIPHSAGANMLPWIEAASREFLARRIPYRAFNSIAGEAPFGYLPVLWLPYTLFVWLGLEIRILNLLALLLLVALFERGLGLANRPEVLSLTFYPLIFSSTSAVMIVHGHVWPYWLLLCVTAVLLMNDRPLPASAVFGLALAARQPALFLAGPFAAYMLRESGLKATLKYATITVGVFACVVLPFAFWTGRSFWDYTYFRLAENIALGDQDPFISAQSMLDVFGLRWRLAPLQPILILVVMALVLFWGQWNGVGFIFATGVLYTSLVFFSFYAIRYEYFPGLFLMAIGLAKSLIGRHLNPRPTLRS